jgi:hypothetical protein
MARAPLSLVVAGSGRNGSPAIYEDAGDGYEQLRGAYRNTGVSLDRMPEGFLLHRATAGQFSAPRPLAAVEFLGFQSLGRVRADGRDLNVSRPEGGAGRLVVALPPEGFDDLTFVP